MRKVEVEFNRDDFPIIVATLLDYRRRNKPAHEHREEDGKGKNKGESIHNDLGKDCGCFVQRDRSSKYSISHK
jgi:hypothetical protein